ncbi:MAG: hypothetical protein AAFZ18_00395 [Myxococcota bacterium]
MKIYLCRGSDCSKTKLPRKQLEAHVAGATITKVRCQKICKAPVVGVDRGDGPVWFRKVGHRTLEDIGQFVAAGTLSARLKGHEAKKRAGKLRD